MRCKGAYTTGATRKRTYQSPERYGRKSERRTGKTGSIGKTGFFGRAYCGHCARDTKLLNFMNNFADINMDLLAGLKEEAGKRKRNEVNAIAE